MIRWRKEPSEKGLARITQGPRGVDLVADGQIVLRVRPSMNMCREIQGWYFYGMNVNTAHSLIQNIEAAKIAARAYYDSHK